MSTLPTFFGSGTTASGTTADLTPPLPTGWAVDDIFILAVETDREDVTIPSGWAHITGSPVETSATDGTRLSLMWRRAQSGDTAPTLLGAGHNHQMSKIYAFRGCVKTGSPFNVISTGNQDTGSTSVVIPGTTTTIPSCLIVIGCSAATDTAASQFSAWANASLGNVGEIGDNFTASGNGGGMALATGTKAAAGAYGNTTATLATSSKYAYMTLALAPEYIVGAAAVAGAGAFSATPALGKTGAANVTGTGTISASGVVIVPQAPSLGIALGTYGFTPSSSTITPGINASVLSIGVVSNAATGWRDPWTTSYIVQIDNERILISSSTPTVLTVAAGGRGYDGTTAASHSSGAAVYFCYIVDRNCGLGYAIECHEAQVDEDAGISGFRYGASRHYNFLDEAWPPNADNNRGKPISSWLADRLIVTSWKTGGPTWRQAADAVSGALYNQIVARGQEIAVWQAARAGLGRWGATFVWGPPHEPNNGDESNASISGSSTASVGRQNYRDMMENIYNIWAAQGVTFWEGNLAGDTTQEGLITSFCLAGQADSYPASLWTDWWPASWTWGNAHIDMPAVDAYNKGPNFRRFARVMGATDIPNAKAGYKAFVDAKRITQAALGRPLLTGIFETGCIERQAGAFTQNGADWGNTGLTATKANWLTEMRSYIAANWPDLNVLLFYENSTASTSVNEWQLDTTQEAWNAWMGVTQDPTFAPELPATAPSATNARAQTFGPATSFTAAAVTLATKPTLITVISGHATPATIPTAAGTHSTTWTQVATVESNTSAVRRRETVFVGYPVAGTEDIVIDFGGVSQDGGAVFIDQFNDAHISNLIVQAKTQVGLTFGAVTIPFTAPPISGNAVFVTAALNNNVGLSPAAGYTALGDTTWATPNSSGLTSFISLHDDPADFTIDGTTAFQYAAIAIEIRATDGKEIISGAAAVAGAGSILASGLVEPGTATIVTGEADVDGDGAVDATGVLGLVGTANVAGAGAIAATSIRVKLGVAALAGAGAIEASGFVILPPYQGSAQVFGQGAWSATGINLADVIQGSAMLGGAALWNATGIVSRPPTMVAGREQTLMGGPIPPTPSSW